MSPSKLAPRPSKDRPMRVATRSGAVSAHSSKDTTTTLFSFGYWGTGSATRALVDGVNQAEAIRGFEPPVWADIRISRSVRAIGFQDRAFERLLGANYVWIPELGNLRISKGGPGRIRIQNPAAVEDLLDQARSFPRRRVIFFCACKFPDECHRHAVSALIRKAAKQRTIPVNVVEWPGGEPSAMRIEVPLLTLRAVAHGSRKTLELPRGMKLGSAASLAWGTAITLTAGTESISILAGPAQFTERGAHLKILSADFFDAPALRPKDGYTPLG